MAGWQVLAAVRCTAIRDFADQHTICCAATGPCCTPSAMLHASVCFSSVWLRLHMAVSPQAPVVNGAGAYALPCHTPFCMAANARWLSTTSSATRPIRRHTSIFRSRSPTALHARLSTSRHASTHAHTCRHSHPCPLTDMYAAMHM